MGYARLAIILFVVSFQVQASFLGPVDQVQNLPGYIELNPELPKKGVKFTQQEDAVMLRCASRGTMPLLPLGEARLLRHVPHCLCAWQMTASRGGCASRDPIFRRPSGR